VASGNKRELTTGNRADPISRQRQKWILDRGCFLLVRNAPAEPTVRTVTPEPSASLKAEGKRAAPACATWAPKLPPRDRSRLTRCVRPADAARWPGSEKTVARRISSAGLVDCLDGAQQLAADPGAGVDDHLFTRPPSFPNERLVPVSIPCYPPADISLAWPPDHQRNPNDVSPSGQRLSSTLPGSAIRQSSFFEPPRDPMFTAFQRPRGLRPNRLERDFRHADRQAASTTVPSRSRQWGKSAGQTGRLGDCLGRSRVGALPARSVPYKISLLSSSREPGPLGD